MKPTNELVINIVWPKNRKWVIRGEFVNVLMFVGYLKILYKSHSGQSNMIIENEMARMTIPLNCLFS